MALGARGDKFGVTLYNLLKTGGYLDASAMGSNEVRVKLIDGDFVWVIKDGATEKTIEKTRSQERTYHGQGVIDENNPIYIPFNVFAAATSVKLKLWGVNFPSFHYTEMPAHNHFAQAFASTAHVHPFSAAVSTSSEGTHGHPFSGVRGASEGENAGHSHPYFRVSGGGWWVNTDNNSNDHAHYFTAIGYVENDGAHAHGVTVSGNTDVPSATTAIPSQGISGYTLNDTAKVQIDTLIQLFITAVQGTWGTAKDKNTTTPVNFSSLANINANGGTDEIDIFAHITAGSFNYIKISEPTAKKGGTILWHLSVS